MGWRLVVASLCAHLVLAGCAPSHVYRVPAATAEHPCVVPVPADDVLVGVSMSGGGSRAALFGAAGLQALGELRTADGSSVLERVSHLSSVSGGSLAATYYVLNKPPRAIPVLAPDGAMTDPYRAFFARYTAVLGQNFERELIRRQLTSLRWLNPALAGRSLAQVLEERLLGDATMLDLSRRQASGDSPGLIINTTLYNNGRRLAATTLPPASFRYDFVGDLEQSLERQGRPAAIPPILKRRAELLLPMTPIDLGMDACAGLLAGWVTASAAFPPLVGPISLRVGEQEIYWHVGDGGLYENQGAESLLFLFLKQLQDRRIRRALLIAFDSSFPFSVGDRRLSQRAQPFTLRSFDFSRVPSIMEERATSYQALFFNSLRLEGVFPGDDVLRVVPLRHIEAEWRPDLADLPGACRGETPPLQSPAAVADRVAAIPTRLHVKSECDRQLLAVAAAKLVARHRARILEFLDAGPAARR